MTTPEPPARRYRSIGTDRRSSLNGARPVKRDSRRGEGGQAPVVARSKRSGLGKKL